MISPKTLGLAGGTLFCALGIGFVMQYGFLRAGAPAPQVEVTDIQDTSAATGLRDLPKAMPLDSAALPQLPYGMVRLAAADGSTIPTMPTESAPVAGFGCDPELSATPIAGALVRLKLTAPCHASERVSLHHSGLMITETTQPDGSLVLDFPALTEGAVFIASFSDDSGAVAQATVSSLAFYDRIVLQWQGEGDLELHAREWEADYFSEGHVWTGAAGTLEAAARGESGFLLNLGDDEAPEARRAQVYSFPAGTAARGGLIDVSVEAAVTEATCETDISAQTLEMRDGGAPTVRDIDLAFPGCDSVGDYLVLNNLIADLKIAAR